MGWLSSDDIFDERDACRLYLMEQRVCGAAVKCGECFAADDAIDLDAEDFLYLFDAVDARRPHPIDNDICDGLIFDLVGLPPIPIL